MGERLTEIADRNIAREKKDSQAIDDFFPGKNTNSINQLSI